MNSVFQWIGISATIIMAVFYLLFIPYMLVDIYNNIAELKNMVNEVKDTQREEMDASVTKNRTL